MESNAGETPRLNVKPEAGAEEVAARLRLEVLAAAYRQDARDPSLLEEAEAWNAVVDDGIES